MDIKSLDNFSFGELFEAFSQAFANYELQLNKAELMAMLKRRGFNQTLSFAAIDKGKIVSFTYNGIGSFYGIPTAYDTGTGTLPDYRGRGLATNIFEYSIPFLKQAGIKQYLLEVLQHNTAAVSVYKKIGFDITREFHYFKQEINAITNKQKLPLSTYKIENININEFKYITEFWDFNTSWQNSFEAINRATEEFITYGVFYADKLIGYTVFEPASGDITQIAVHKNYRRMGVGSLLFQKVLDCTQVNTVKIINTDITCESITAFLHSKNIEPSGKQYEMINKW